MVDTLNIYSINTNGLRSLSKQLSIKDFIKKNKVDILCIQETHVNSRALANQIENNFNNCFKFFWSLSFSSHSAGVCVIISNALISYSKFQTDNDGRLLYIDIKFDNKCFRLVNPFHSATYLDNYL